VPVLELVQHPRLTIALLVCVEQPRMRASERCPPAKAPRRARWHGCVWCARILDISLGGARLAGTARASPGIVTVALGDLRLPGRIVRSADNEFAIHFDESQAGTPISSGSSTRGASPPPSRASSRHAWLPPCWGGSCAEVSTEITAAMA